MYGILLGIGVVISIITSLSISSVITPDDMHIESNTKNKSTIIFLNVITSISIVLTLGIINAECICSYLMEKNMATIIVPIILIPVFSFSFWFFVKLYSFSRKASQVWFIVVLIISTYGWTNYRYNYKINYERNIETINETIITSEQERRILSFHSIPTQEVIGGYNKSFLSNEFFIATNDTITFWYVNENGEGICDSVPIQSAKIVFLEDDQKYPYLHSCKYCSYTKTINHNNGKEETIINNEWEEHIFYLPKDSVQYPIE